MDPRLPVPVEQCDACSRHCTDVEYLPCEHVVCPPCFEDAVARESTTGCAICDSASHSYSDSAAAAESIKCDLCTDNASAVSHCDQCHCFLCEFCEQAHQRQRRTADHVLILLRGIDGHYHDANYEQQDDIGNIASPIPCCPHNRPESAKYFCETCDTCLCLECKDEAHVDHHTVTMTEMDVHCSEKLQNLLTKTKPMVSTLKESIQSIECLLASVEDRANEVTDRVYHSIDEHIAALQEHKMLLLSKLDAIKMYKMQVLSHQLGSLSQTLEDIRRTCDVASKVLTPESSPADSVALRLSIARQLEELTDGRYEYRPQEDDYIHFLPKVNVGKRGSYDVYGMLDTQTPSPGHSVLEGDGLHRASQRRTAMFNVIIFDKNGERKLVGGDRVELRVHSTTGSPVKTEVLDKGDGSYQLSYVSDSQREHRVSVLLGNKHIRGSPVLVEVRPRRKHRGIFHCCTFCSSGGKKHVTCGCDGTMPGGYSGCGHGHKGHPGKKHWSCCGSIEEDSDCIL